MFKKLLGDASRRFSGQKDFLEGCCAAAALIASADGNVDEAEANALMETLTNHPVLGTAYNSAEIGRVADDMLRRAKGFTGKAGLYKEITEAGANDADKAETMLLIALDVAHADGEMSDVERQVAEKIAGVLRLDLKKLMV